jgi:hypothetical protein
MHILAPANGGAAAAAASHNFLRRFKNKTTGNKHLALGALVIKIMDSPTAASFDARPLNYAAPLIRTGQMRLIPLSHAPRLHYVSSAGHFWGPRHS